MFFAVPPRVVLNINPFARHLFPVTILVTGLRLHHLVGLALPEIANPDNEKASSALV
jgi:hypothetical protein